MKFKYSLSIPNDYPKMCESVNPIAFSVWLVLSANKKLRFSENLFPKSVLKNHAIGLTVSSVCKLYLKWRLSRTYRRQRNHSIGTAFSRDLYCYLDNLLYQLDSLPDPLYLSTKCKRLSCQFLRRNKSRLRPVIGAETWWRHELVILPVSLLI